MNRPSTIVISDWLANCQVGQRTPFEAASALKATLAKEGYVIVSKEPPSYMNSQAKANYRMNINAGDRVVRQSYDSPAVPGVERDELAEWKQAAGVEANVRREFLARAEAAEEELAEGHLALDRVGALKEDHGDALTIAERVVALIEPPASAAVSLRERKTPEA